jgi:hypothetical protein
MNDTTNDHQAAPTGALQRMEGGHSTEIGQPPSYDIEKMDSRQNAASEIARPEIIKPPVTAAQAKVEAVASLTFKAYERASMLTLTPEEIASLQADFPDEAFKPGAAGKEHLIYIEHAFLRDRLNQVIGIGQWALIPRNRWAEDFKTTNGKSASRVYVEAMLVVRGAFVSEAVGEMEYYPNNASQNYGDAVEGAKTAALRRCCKEFGVGLQAWKKDWTEGWWDRRNNRRDTAAAKTYPVGAPKQYVPAPNAGASPPPQQNAASETITGYGAIRTVTQETITSRSSGKTYKPWRVVIQSGEEEIKPACWSKSVAEVAQKLADDGGEVEFVIEKKDGKLSLVEVKRREPELPLSREDGQGAGEGDDEPPF